MFFLLRMALLLSVILALLPSGGAKKSDAPGTEVSAVDAVSAASATVSDMWQFCTRQPQACAIGSHAAAAFGERAQAGARMVYGYISERSGSGSGSGQIETGSITRPIRPAIKASQDTLTATDLAPAWRGPRRDTRNKHGA